MTIEYENNDVVETVQLTDDEALDAIMDDDHDDIIIDNAAVFTIDYDAQQLIIYYDGARNVVMELEDDFEVALCDKVLSDPNFWLEFMSSFSAALKRTNG